MIPKWLLSVALLAFFSSSTCLAQIKCSDQNIVSTALELTKKMVDDVNVAKSVIGNRIFFFSLNNATMQLSSFRTSQIQGGSIDCKAQLIITLIPDEKLKERGIQTDHVEKILIYKAEPTDDGNLFVTVKEIQ